MLRNWPVKLTLIAVVMGVLGVLTYGGVTVATHDYSDVPNGAFYHDDASWLGDRLITTGCAAGEYCPNNKVTRGEMASFLKRTGDVFTPTFLDATGPCIIFCGTTLNLDASPVVCQTADYTPTYEQQALMMGRTSITAQNGDESYYAYGVYSTDGGTSWSNFSPGWSVEAQATAAGQEVAVPYMGHTDLTPGMTYNFGVQLVDAEGSDGGAGNEASAYWCGVTVEILNRQP